jgi:flagellar protein FliJ
MSASTNALNTLLDLAKNELDVAIAHMVQAKKALDEAREKGNMLRGYRQDYVDNLTKLLGKGLGKETHNNYQNFLKKLDQAITGQAEVVISAEYEHANACKIWQELQRKKLSYEILLARKSKKAHHTALKIDQKMMDEYAMRAKRSRAV